MFGLLGGGVNREMPKSEISEIMERTLYNCFRDDFTIYFTNLPPAKIQIYSALKKICQNLPLEADIAFRV